MLYKLAPFIIVSLMFAIPMISAYVIGRIYEKESLIFTTNHTMGLDMYLIRHEESSGGERENEFIVAQWRKANAIHSYVVTKHAEGVDECQEIPLTIEDIAELNKVCKSVLENPKNAEYLLPTASGFFFGSTSYDEWYMQDLQDTVKMLDYIELMNRDWCHKYYYEASW